MLIPLSRGQVVALDSLRASEWHGALTPLEYAHRNERLRSHGYGDKIESWGWSLDQGATLLASCSLLPVSFVAKIDGSVSGWLLASVVTPPEHRGHGYASAMLEALLDRRGEKPWILFSDIGPEFYARWDFKSLPRVSQTATATDGEVDLAAASPAFVAETISTRRAGGRTYAPEEIDWIAERYRAFAEFRDLIDVPVILDCGDSANPVFVAVDAVRDELAVLWADPKDSDAVPRARDAAGALGLSTVSYWEPVPDAVEGTKPEWPMIRDPKEELAPVSDVQFVDWW